MQAYLSTADSTLYSHLLAVIHTLWLHIICFFLEADIASLGQIFQGVSFTVIPQNIYLGFCSTFVYILPPAKRYKNG